MTLAAVVRAGLPQWQQFGAQHLAVLGAALLSCACLVAYRRELKASGTRVDVWLVAILATVHLAWVVAARVTGLAGIGDLLPLYTCDASVLVGVAWCVWKPRWLGQVLFVWAALGGVVTLLLPDTFGYALPHFAAVYTLVFHGLLLLLALELWLVEGVHPTRSTFFVVSGVTALLVPPSLVANARLDADYMFVSRDPGGIFTFVDHFSGAARVLVMLGCGAALLLVCLAVWHLLETLLRARELRRPDDGVR